MKLKGFQNFLKNTKILNLPLTSINSIALKILGKNKKNILQEGVRKITSNCLTISKKCLDKWYHFTGGTNGYPEYEKICIGVLWEGMC